MLSAPLTRRLAAAAIVLGALWGVTGCTGLPSSGSGSGSGSGSSGSETSEGSGSGGQTVAEACTLVSDTITSATDEFEQATSDDPAAVADAFTAAAQSVSDAGAEVTNEEVAALLPPLQDLFERVAELLPAIIEGDTARAAEFQEVGDDLQTTMGEFDALCGSSE